MFVGAQIGNWVNELLPEDAMVVDGNEQSMRFYDWFYALEETKSGYHHPDGVLWIRTGQHQVEEEAVSILDIFPTIEEFFGVKARADSGRIGRSLLPILS